MSASGHARPINGRNKNQVALHESQEIDRVKMGRPCFILPAAILWVVKSTSTGRARMRTTVSEVEVEASRRHQDLSSTLR